MGRNNQAIVLGAHLTSLRFHERLAGTRPKRQPKPKTRRHLARTRQAVYTDYGRTGEMVTFRFIVNTGKDYSPQHIGHDAAGAFLTTDAAVASTRDIRGHGHSTSRVKRTRRQLMELWRGWRRSRPPEIHERLAAGAAE